MGTGLTTRWPGAAPAHIHPSPSPGPSARTAATPTPRQYLPRHRIHGRARCLPPQITLRSGPAQRSLVARPRARPPPPIFSCSAPAGGGRPPMPNWGPLAHHQCAT
jgi:hypothetical protein